MEVGRILIFLTYNYFNNKNPCIDKKSYYHFCAQITQIPLNSFREQVNVCTEYDPNLCMESNGKIKNIILCLLFIEQKRFSS